MPGDNRINDDDEGPGRAADLHAAAPKCRDQEAADDGRDKPLRGRRARGDGDGEAQGQGDHGDGDTGHDIGRQERARVGLQCGRQFRMHGRCPKSIGGEPSQPAPVLTRRQYATGRVYCAVCRCPAAIPALENQKAPSGGTGP